MLAKKRKDEIQTCTHCGKSERGREDSVRRRGLWKKKNILVSQSPTLPKGRENQREKQSWSLISQWNWFGMFCLNGLTQTWTYIIIITLFSTSVGKSTLKCLPSYNLLRSESSSTSRDALYWMSSCLFKYRSVRLCHFFFNNSDGFWIKHLNWGLALNRYI